MKTRNILTALFFLSITALFSQENSLLWKISGNGLKHDSYLYGTLHMMCPDDFSMSQKLKSSLDIVDKVYFEVDLGNSESEETMKNLMAPKPEFIKSFTKEQHKFIDSTLNSHSLSIQMLDMLSPLAMTSIISMVSFGCPNPMDLKSYEVEIRSEAKNKGKSFGELETLEYQMKLMETLTTPDEFYKLVSQMDQYRELTYKMVSAYKTENLSELGNILLDSKWMSKVHYEKMLIERNKNWMKLMPSIMNDHKTLFAVGAGHLVGDDGLIDLLKKSGYNVTPVIE